jgi:arsenate reductase
MAAAIFNAMADPATARALSAGTDPGPRVHPEVVDAMRESGIDLTGMTPQRLTDDLAGQAQWLITMGCGDQCPVIPGLRRDDWPLADPKGQTPAQVQAIRDAVAARVRGLVTQHGWAATANVEDARPDDAGAILDLLQRSHLPTEGLMDHIGSALVARQNGRVVGTAALEVYADGALLRSVAVDPLLRGTGLGHRLTETALARAEARGLPAVFLLTTTAERFFPRFGFRRIDRAAVPGGVRQSVEFTSACCASAIVMRKLLGAPRA